jgi:hypothetical protein
MPSVSIAELQVTVKKYDNIECCTKKILLQIYVPGNNKEYLILNAKDPTFLSGFNKTRSFSTDVRKSLISSFMEIRPVATALVHADRRRNSRTEGNVEANRRLS